MLEIALLVCEAVSERTIVLMICARWVGEGASEGDGVGLGEGVWVWGWCFCGFLWSEGVMCDRELSRLVLLLCVFLRF